MRTFLAAFSLVGWGFAGFFAYHLHQTWLASDQYEKDLAVYRDVFKMNIKDALSETNFRYIHSPDAPIRRQNDPTLVLDKVKNAG